MATDRLESKYLAEIASFLQKSATDPDFDVSSAMPGGDCRIRAGHVAVGACIMVDKSIPDQLIENVTASAPEKMKSPLNRMMREYNRTFDDDMVQGGAGDMLRPVCGNNLISSLAEGNNPMDLFRNRSRLSSLSMETARKLIE